MGLRWTPEQLAEYNAKRQSWLGVCGEDTVASPPQTPDRGPESKLQAKIMAWAKERGYPCFHDRSRKKNEAGWADIFLYLPEGRHVLIELKSAKGRLTKEQKGLRLQLTFLGHEWHKITSFKQFLAVVGDKQKTI